MNKSFKCFFNPFTEILENDYQEGYKNTLLSLIDQMDKIDKKEKKILFYTMVNIIDKIDEKERKILFKLLKRGEKYEKYTIIKVKNI